MAPSTVSPAVTVESSPGPDHRRFGSDLRTAVDQRLSEGVLRRAHRQLQSKAVVIGAWYLASYALLLVAGSWWLGILACASLALAMAGVGFNVQHDANHNALFRTKGSKRLTGANRAAGWSMYALGGSSKRWIDGHVYVHHAATNVVGRDDDIELAPFGRFAPQQARRPWHRFQHLYLWAVYCFTALAIMVADVASTVTESITGDRHGRRPTVLEYVELLATKAVFVFLMVGVPLLMHPWWIVLLGIALTLSVAGLLLGVVFQLAHVVEEAEFRQDGAENAIRWHEWQVRSTVDFCQGSGPVDRLVTWYTGGLNHQTEHHLFPQVPHTAYPVIAPAVREVCDAFEIPYRVQPTLRQAIASHYRHLRHLGRA
ncbi:fatty acid desaturase family protein [Rhabdothermincola salaria]|uniref:fatty acid desaturase family protein n=1 Tax=Rhabdothermincola salaria TaxID=2903142 RepID=UPI001E428C7C|nr:acyl-CoA desaturase [Rhabdothermincola salaria]